jgi:choline dehydrogenase
MQPFAGKEIGPGENAETDKDIEDYIRSKSETAYPSFMYPKNGCR